MFVCDYCGEERIYTNEGNKNSHILASKTKKAKKHKAADVSKSKQTPLSLAFIFEGIPISKKNLLELLQCENKEHLMYPKDKQNVLSATKFLLAFMDSVSPENTSALPYSLLSIKNELYLLSLVFKGLLSFYFYVDSSLADHFSCIIHTNVSVSSIQVEINSSSIIS